MRVSVKQFDVDMEIKNRGIELEIRDPSGVKQLGDLILTKTQLIWCPGKTSRKFGKSLTWEKFIELIGSNAK